MTDRQMTAFGVLVILAAIALAFRGGELVERDRHAEPTTVLVVNPDGNPGTVLPVRTLADVCAAAAEAEALYHRADDGAVYTYAGDPADGNLCARVPFDLIVYE